MIRSIRIIQALFLSLILSGCTLGAKAGLTVTSQPSANVTLDGKALGKTPLDLKNLKPGTFDIKLSPTEGDLLEWDNKITLNQGITTVVDRQLASELNKGYGYVLTFEKLANKTASEVHILSTPDTVSVSIDGAPQGFTPYKSDSVTPGSHTFTLTSPGYRELVVKAKVLTGYRLIITGSLAVDVPVPTPTPQLEATPSATPSPTLKATSATEVTPLPKQATTSSTLKKPYIEIKSTPTGWLKVRSEPNLSGAEVAKVNPGDKFPYLETEGSWYQIEYVTDKTGWISATYATLVK